MRRAFAMPMVVLLTLAASIMVAVLLNRNSIRRSDAEFELQSYIQEHRQRGVREIVSLWLQFSAQQDLEALLADDGLAFTIDFNAGRRLEVRLVPLQGAPLVEPEGLGPLQPAAQTMPVQRQREITRLTALALGERAGSLGRTTGPLAVSLSDASDEALRAMAQAVLQNEALSEAYASALGRLRAEGEVPDRESLVTLAREVGIEEQSLQTELAQLWTTRPSLWGVRTEIVGPGPTPGSTRVERYEATIFIPREESTSALLSGSEHASAWFLDWRQLEEGTGYTALPGRGAERGGRG